MESNRSKYTKLVLLAGNWCVHIFWNVGNKCFVILYVKCIERNEYMNALYHKKAERIFQNYVSKQKQA